MKKEIIKINNLNKSYGNFKAVDNLNLSVREGQLYAFLGVNGAGKSTTISMMCGNLKIDSGSIFICDKDVSKNNEYIKNNIGVVFQNSILDKTLTIYENLKYRAALYQIFNKDFEKRYKELKELLDLNEIENKKIKNLSGGQRRKVDIARAIIHEPKILILDEPTTGLDPGTRKQIWSIINDLRKNKNLTVFLTTHYMDEASSSDYITIINKGKVITEGTPLELKNKYTSDTLIIYNQEEKEIKKLNKDYEKVKNSYRIKIKNTNEVTKLIINNQEVFKDFELIKGNMDDVFLNATKEEK